MQVLRPSLEEVSKLSGAYDKIPLSFEILADIKTPIGVLQSIKAATKRFFLLESVEGGEKWARYSFLGLNPDKVLKCKNGTVEISSQEGSQQFSSGSIDAVRELVNVGKVAKFDYLPPFTGGAVGYFGYETVRYGESMQLSSVDITKLPDCMMMLFNTLIVFDHLKQKLIVIINIDTAGDVPEAYRAAERKAAELYALIQGEAPQTAAKAPAADLHFTSNKTKEQYMDMVERAREYIRDGDIFQCVPSQRFTARCEGSLFSAYRMLRVINPSPYMYYIQIDDVEIAGASPETLVKVWDGCITNFPIAGTRKRGTTEEEDKALEQELLSDPKELAEHNMLVDLARNDVGKVSEIGSIVVSDYMKIQKYSHVMHITTQVSGQLRAEYDALDALQSVLPAGTLSGAPKIRAMEIIDELEGEQRGIYGGGIGYVAYGGNLDMCIGIRTIVKNGDTAYIQAGGGVVLDSDPASEYEESCNKAMAVLQAIRKGSELQ